MTRLLSHLTTVSVVALGVVLAGPLRAKGFLGSYTVNGGSVSISEVGTTTDFNVLSPQVVIDWVPDDNAINPNAQITFLPTNGIATFRGFSDYAVLNRIGVADASRQILLNGTISSTINSNPGAAVYFYSPSGFVVGSNAAINVGSLVLSASPIAVDGNGGFSNGGLVSFGQAPNVNATIATQAGSQINAFGSGAYVAMVAPSIRHQGTISTDRGVALVAAEAATITFSPDGLYNIQVTQGTDAAIGVDVDGGTITRNVATQEGANHYAYLVTVARNDAVTMLVRNGGSVGFDTATSAAAGENNSVVLGGDYDVFNGNPSFVGGPSTVGLIVNGASFSSNTTAALIGGANISSSSGATSFGRNLTLIVERDTLVEAAGGNALGIGGNLGIFANRLSGGTLATAPNVRLSAIQGADLTVGGNVNMTATAYGDDSLSEGLTATSAQGGIVTVQASGAGSLISITGSLNLEASAFGGNVFYNTGTGGTGRGGTAEVVANNGASVSVIGSTTLTADGWGGGTGEGEGSQVGGNGTGGDIRITSANGTGNSVSLGVVNISAIGYGGPGGLATGNGKGGTLNFYAAGGAITIGGALNAEMDGSGGYGFATATGGIGEGGTFNIGFGPGGGSISLGDVDAQVEGRGGDGLAGGLGRGGDMSYSTLNGGALTVGGVADLRAEGDGGGAFGGDAGDAEGGNFILQTQGGTVAFASDVSASTDAHGGSTESGGDGGDAVAGRTQMFANGGGSLTIGADLSLSAVSHGGFGVNGGNALAFIGGNPRATATTDVRLVARNGSIAVGGFTRLDVDSIGGDGASGGNGGDAAAGFAALFAGNSNGGPSSITVGDVSLTADAAGGAGGGGTFGAIGGDGGDGGDASSGLTVATAAAGNGTLVAGDVVLSASATGGAGGGGGFGTNGAGGNGGNGGNAIASIEPTVTRGATAGTESDIPEATATNDGSATFASIIARANATGGDGGDFGFGTVAGIAGGGGNAFAGSPTLLVRGSLLTVGDVLLESLATGGDGGFDANDAIEGAGGKAVAGATVVIVTNRNQIAAQRGTLDSGAITAVAGASGGEGPGGTFGGSYLVDGSIFEIINSEATIDSLSMTVTAPDGYDPAATATNAGRITVIGGSAVVTGDFAATTAGRLSVHANNGTLGASIFEVTADNFVHDETRAFPASVGTIGATNIFLTTGQDLIVDAHLDSVNGVGFTAPGLIDIENVESNGPLALTAGTTVDAGNLTAGTLVAVNGGGSINLGNIRAGTQQVIVQTTAGDITTGSISAGAFTGLSAPGDVTTGNIVAALDDISINAGGSITTGNATSTNGDIFLIAGDAITTGNLSSFGLIVLDAFGDIDVGNVNADDFDAETDGDVTGGNIIAGTFAGVETLGSITLGDIAVGTVRTGGPSEDGFAVGMASGTSISVGDVEADESIGFATLGNLATGDLDAGYGVMALVGGNMNLGSITTPGNGLVYLADSSMFLDAGGADEFDPLQVLARDPVPTGGSITINGPVSTGTFQAAAGTGFTTGAIDASSIHATAGGLLTINGPWTAAEVEATSDDIAIAATGRIDAGATGTITLVSSNTNGAFLGDGLTGTGYNLSNAEFGRLRSGNLRIAAGVGPDAAGQMTIGDLDISGPLVGSTIDDPNGGVTFITLDEAGEGLDGQIRIVGEVTATGFGANNFLEYMTENFNLDADTGSIRIEGTGGALGGILDITADRIHVASGAVLDKLDANPLYAGREADLAAPLSVARPGGVIAADTIFVSPTEAVLVQNSGTTALRAGFLAREVELFAPEGAAPGSIELIVNGQGLVDGVTFTGVAVRDALVEDTDLSIYTDNSSINGCPLVGACLTFGGPGFTPLPGIPDEIRLIDRGKPPPPLFGNEDFIDDNDEETEDGATSPITPPQPLFDTSALSDGAVSDDGSTGSRPLIGTPMRSNPGQERKGDVDDPVSGSGNPSLMDGPANPAK